MHSYTKEDVLRLIQEEDVEFIRLQFTDYRGNLKNIAITSRQLQEVLSDGAKFDASIVDRFPNPEGVERFLEPDFGTFEIFPWRPQQGKVARLLCDTYLEDGTPSDGNPRRVLKNVLERARKMGYEFYVSPDLEFFLFETDEQAAPTTTTYEQAGFFDVGPLDCGENARRDIVMSLEDMGININASHHEAAPAQHEIDLSRTGALETADNLQTAKLAVRTIAKRHGLHGTFMPKPKFGVNGSGLHLHLYVEKDGKDLFYSETDINHLSREAYYFIGGLTQHLRSASAFTNPLVNSYKRLVDGYEAPVYVAWSAVNRNQMIRVSAKAKPGENRIELRNPDGAANPYLMLAAIIAAGLDGIESQIEAPHPIDDPIQEMTPDERMLLGIEKLPETLIEAVEALEKDKFYRGVFGDTIMSRYISIKRGEWDEYRIQVSDWELKEYLNRY
ncbi:MAG: type I glutamate--ammonia ligase [Lachnospiraceae bacterium]|nr:type I glutamate--ammonia ligase [Lachnospiraceae bacterium]